MLYMYFIVYISDPHARRPSLPKQPVLDAVLLPSTTTTASCKVCKGVGILFERAKKVKCDSCQGSGTVTVSTQPNLLSTSPPRSPNNYNLTGYTDFYFYFDLLLLLLLLLLLSLFIMS